MEEAQNDVDVGDKIRVRGLNGTLRGPRGMFLKVASVPERFQRDSSRFVCLIDEKSNSLLTAPKFGVKAWEDTVVELHLLFASNPLNRDIIRHVASFLVSPGIPDNFCYRPCSFTPAGEGGATEEQVFCLQRIGRNRFGIRTWYGQYLRAPTWSRHILQSPHLLGDETFDIYKIEREPNT